MHTIGELLKQWRQRRQLSQLDLAISADVSPRHVSLIETGKSNPSADMIVRLAARLDVPLRDRNRLLLAAGFAPRYAERPLDGQALSIARHAIDRVLRGHEPYPAVVLDRRWNIVATNDAAAAFFDDLDPDLLRPPVNIVWLALDPRGLASRIDNLDDVRSVLLSRITRQLAAAPDAQLTQLYEQLAASHTDGTASLVRESDIVLPMIFRLDEQVVRLFSMTTTFGSPMDVTLDEVLIELYYPADEETATYLERKASSRRNEPAPK
jgi:transcriptional regulator with XRE-family HTH domain